MAKNKDKTVYVLGAGFSIEAGAPSQESIVKKILEFDLQYPDRFQKGAIDKFKKFLTNTMCIPDKLHSQIPLEDIFTPLDRCILDDTNFRDLNVKGVVDTRRNINYLIAEYLRLKLETTDKSYIDKFAKYIVSKAKNRAFGNYTKTDPVSVISMNWDILLDNSLKTALSEIDDEKLREQLNVVDYCCYISSYQKEDKSVKPGLEALGKGGFNVKLLKLHGSLNWLNCPRCKGLFVEFHEKIGLYDYYNPKYCRHCEDNFKGQQSNLASLLVMPTFLKNLSSTQMKLIWTNAGVEFSEARRVVFIGYSLPQADFELRQLMSRMIRDDAEIEVVDYENVNLSGKDKLAEEIRIDQLKSRYEAFFGSRCPSFHLLGAKAFIEKDILRKD